MGCSEEVAVSALRLDHYTRDSIRHALCNRVAGRTTESETKQQRHGRCCRRQKKKDKLAKDAAVDKKSKEDALVLTIEHGPSRGTVYKSGSGETHTTTGGHRSSIGPKSTKRACEVIRRVYKVQLSCDELHAEHARHALRFAKQRGAHSIVRQHIRNSAVDHHSTSSSDRLLEEKGIRKDDTSGKAPSDDTSDTKKPSLKDKIKAKLHKH